MEIGNTPFSKNSGTYLEEEVYKKSKLIKVIFNNPIDESHLDSNPERIKSNNSLGAPKHEKNPFFSFYSISNFL